MKRLIWNNKISTSSEQLEELQWDCQERCELKLKVTKKNKASFSLKVSLNLSKFEVNENFPRFPSFRFWVQSKIEKSETSENFIFSSKSISWSLSFCLSSFLSFLNLKLEQLSKFEVKEHFPRFPSFRFQVYGKIKNSETSEIFFFSSKCIS